MKRTVNYQMFAGVAVMLAACGGGSDTVVAPVETVPADRTPITVVMTVSKSSGQVVAAQDTVVIAGYRDHYTITNIHGVVTLTNKITGEVRTLVNVKLIKFADKHTSFDVEGTGGKVYRLYQAAFSRKPDQAGLGFWIAQAENSMSMEAISKGFTDSKEYADMYGEVPSGTTMVTKWYNNVLHRAPEQAGLDYWVKALTSGLLAEQGLIGFSESDENKKNLVAELTAGFEYTPYRKAGDAIPVKASSYANAKENGVGAENIPNVAVQGYTILAYAFADFQQNGTMSLVTHSLEYDAGKPETKNSVGKVAFWSKNAAGAWDNITSKLLANTAGCLHARKAVVADYNGDGKPDVFFACTGFDTSPFTGEKQVVVLSQTDGTYKTDVLPVTCYCHGASAAELNTAGYADIAVTDIATDKGSFMLRNNMNGTFTTDFDAMPTVARGKPVFTAELLDYDRDGKVDLFLAGIENATGATFTPTIFRNNGANNFNDAAPTVFPTASKFNTTLDIVVDGDNTYLLRTPADYMGTAIQKITKDGVATMIFSNIGYLNKEKNLVWVDWITISNGKVVSQNAMYNVAVTK